MSKVKTETGETTTITIDAELQRRLKVKCAELGCTMREQVEELIEGWLAGKEVRV
jgi:hypothetical protein